MEGNFGAKLGLTTVVYKTIHNSFHISRRIHINQFVPEMNLLVYSFPLLLRALTLKLTILWMTPMLLTDEVTGGH